MPPAPARFSTTNDCPSTSLYRFASMRACVSVVPPGAKGTTMRTVLAGQVWANALADENAATHAAAMKVFCTTVPPLRFVYTPNLLVGCALLHPPYLTASPRHCVTASLKSCRK